MDPNQQTKPADLCLHCFHEMAKFFFSFFFFLIFFFGFSMGRNQYWAGRVYDLSV